MQFVGDSISKIEATRSEKVERPLAIKANVQVTGIEKKEFFAATEKTEGIVIKYLFEVLYGETSGKILIEGMILVVGDKKDLKKLEDEWEKNKKIEGDLIIPIMNRAMELGYLTAIPVAKELKLATPLRMPKFVKGEENEKTKAS